jgi:hypothetical protein
MKTAKDAETTEQGGERGEEQRIIQKVVQPYYFRKEKIACKL